MSNPAGRKGYAGENPVLGFMHRIGFHRAYRLRNQGVSDKGDLGGIDEVCIEIKNHGRYDFGTWMKETAAEKANAGAATAALVVKPKGVGDTRVGEWWAVLTLSDYAQLLIDAGYGPHSEESTDAAQESGAR